MAEKEGNGKPPIITLGEPTRIIPGVPTGGMKGWSVPICLVMAAEAASAAAWAAIMATLKPIAAAMAPSSAAPATLPAAAVTLLATLPTLLATPASLPSLIGTLGDGTWKQCMVMSMFARAAREPPM